MAMLVDSVRLIEVQEHDALAPAIRDLVALTRLNFLVNFALETGNSSDAVDGEIRYDLAREIEYLGLQIKDLYTKCPVTIVALPPRAGA